MKNKKCFNPEIWPWAETPPAGPDQFRFSPLHVAHIMGQWLPSHVAWQATDRPSGALPAQRH
jgi:hypothetical protein